MKVLRRKEIKEQMLIFPEPILKDWDAIFEDALMGT